MPSRFGYISGRPMPKPSAVGASRILRDRQRAASLIFGKFNTSAVYYNFIFQKRNSRSGKAAKSNHLGSERSGESGVGRGDDPPVCSVLVLHVWPSQSSLGEKADGQSSDTTAEEQLQHPNSGIDSNQASPSPVPQGSRYGSAAPSNKPGAGRAFLHPEHARIMTFRPPDRRPSDASANSGFVTSCSSSAESSTTSIAAGTTSQASDPLQERRRSSTLTARYSILDALDLEYALMRAAGRGSTGPCSLSQSLQKLTFTQSLAFPALARGLADKRSQTEKSPRISSIEPGANAFAKVATALVLVLVSVLVFGVVYKFVRT